MTRCLLALDQGTTRSRAALFSLDGRLLGIAQEEHPQLYPRPGWVEHSPEALWRRYGGFGERLYPLLQELNEVLAA